MHAIRGQQLRLTRIDAPVTRLHATRIDAPTTDVPRRLAFRAAAAAAALAARPSSAQIVTEILADADAIDQPPTDQRR